MNLQDIRESAQALVAGAVASRAVWALVETDDGPDGPEGSQEDGPLASDYLGSVMSLYPSGKYYTPFANGNVDACPKCKGTGKRPKRGDTCKYCGGLGSREAHLDETFTEALDAAAEAAGCWVESGEGDPCDIYIVTRLDG